MKTRSLPLLAALLFSCSSFANPSLDDAMQAANKRTHAAVATQAKIDALDEQTREKLEQYKQVSKEVEGLEVYTEQLKRQLGAQKQEMIDIEASIKQVVMIERNVMPLMLKMIEAIEQFVQLDMPFDIAQRQERTAQLRVIVDRADIAVAEKFRKVLEAYQEEIEYGRTIEASRGSLSIDGLEREVDFLRVGRISYVYSTLDGKQMGAYNKQTAQWEPLSASYRSAMVKALRIAREQAAPDLIEIPLNSVQAAQ